MAKLSPAMRTAWLRSISFAIAAAMKAHSLTHSIIELNGDDLRRDPLEGRKATLEMIPAKAGSGIRFNEHMEGEGEIVFRHACKLGLERIVSKRKDSAYGRDALPTGSR
jgi:ATP-dependent DNA ligase